MKKQVSYIVVISLILVIGFKAFSNSEESNKGKVPNVTDVIKKIEGQIFYPEQQENIESADYTLIYGPQMLRSQREMKLTYGDKKRAKGQVFRGHITYSLDSSLDN